MYALSRYSSRQNVPARCLVAACAVIDRDDVAARAQAALAGAGQHDGADGVVVAPIRSGPARSR